MGIVNVGDSQSFGAGTMNEFIIPFSGIYKLEVYGAIGGRYRSRGGYAVGFKNFKAGERIYVCVGSNGAWNDNVQGIAYGGYNGGGNGYVSGMNGAGGGGGATHIATMNGTLAQIGASNINKILIVAGGSGGGLFSGGLDYNENGGNGGGIRTSGSFGQGESYTLDLAAGGGGGLYGGSAGHGNSSSGGGSSYIAGLPTFIHEGVTYASSETAGASSSPLAKITFMVKTAPNLVFNGTQIGNIIVNGTSVNKIIFNGTEL